MIDCYHNDITHIVEARAVERMLRKARNLKRYTRQYARGRK